MAFRAMKDSILRDGEYNARAKRSGVTVSLDDAGNTLTDPRKNTEPDPGGFGRGKENNPAPKI